MLKLPKILVLDYSKWICGGGVKKGVQTSHGLGSTSLLNDKGYMCCLGQFSCQSGVTPKDIRRKVNPAGMNIVITGLNKPTDYNSTLDTKFSEEAIDINDDLETTIAEKAHKLTLLCSKYKRTLLLKNFPQGVLNQIKGKYNVYKSCKIG